MQSSDTQNSREKNYKTFGIFIIHFVKLNKNILIVKYAKSFAPIPSIKQTKISNTFKYLLIDILDTQKINIDLQNQLIPNELNIFENLLSKSKTIGLLNYKRNNLNQDTLIKAYKIRLTLIQGSFNAGNVNDESIEEAKDLVIKLFKLNEISIDDYNMLINVLTK